jgi:hypothetical protein
MSEFKLAKALLNRENEQHVEAFKARIGLDDSSYSYFEGNSTGHLMTVSRMTEAYFKSLISNFARYESELESNIENSGFDDSYISVYALRVDKDLKQLFWSGYSNVISAIDYDSLAAHLLFIDSPNINPNPENNEIKTRSQEQELKIFYPIADDPFFFELVEKSEWFLEELIDPGLNYLTEEIDRFGYFNSWYTHLLKCIFEGERITSQNLQKSMAEFLGLLWVDVLALFEAFR